MPSAIAPDDTSTTSLPRLRQRGDLRGPARDGVVVEPAAFVGDQAGADLDDDAGARPRPRRPQRHAEAVAHCAHASFGIDAGAPARAARLHAGLASPGFAASGGVASTAVGCASSQS